MVWRPKSQLVQLGSHHSRLCRSTCRYLHVGIRMHLPTSSSMDRSSSFVHLARLGCVLRWSCLLLLPDQRRIRYGYFQQQRSKVSTPVRSKLTPVSPSRTTLPVLQLNTTMRLHLPDLPSPALRPLKSNVPLKTTRSEPTLRSLLLPIFQSATASTKTPLHVESGIQLPINPPKSER